MKNRSLSLLLVSLALILQAQGPDTPITTEKLRLLVLPAESGEDPHSIENEVVAIISDVATRLGRFDVVDRNDLRNILEEQALHLTGLISDSMVVAVGNIASANEALIVDVLNFYQEGVPPGDKKEEEDEDTDEDGEGDIWGRIVLTVVRGIVKSGRKERERERDPYAHNIQTTLAVQVKKVDIETGKSLDSFTISAGHTGGNLGRSRAITMTNLRRQALTRMKHFYSLTSEVISVEGREALLLLGSQVGVKRGTLFEIVRRNRTRSIGNRHIVVPGRRVGIVEVKDSSPEANRSTILRNWLPVRPGDKALEYTRSPGGLEVGYFHSSTNPFSGINMGLLFHPFHGGSLGANLRLANTSDSRDDNDFVLGFGGLGDWRFLRSTRVSLLASLGVDFNLAFRPDDADHTVVAGLLSGSPEVGMELLLSENRDVSIAAGYRFSGQSSHWTYTRQTSDGEPKQVDADWDRPAPVIDLSGMYVTVMMRFILF
ncbi:MAG: hypothetical protein ACE5GH_01265 [Fidelibacterota bacterium]